MNEILLGDIRDIAKTLPDQSVNCVVTSPPYFGLRDYGTAEWEGGEAECDHVSSDRMSQPRLANSPASTRGGAKKIAQVDKMFYLDICPKCSAKRIDKQIGLEATPEAYVNTLVGIFRELKRGLRDDGTVWLNLGDSYAGNNLSNGEGEIRNLKTEIFHGGRAHLEQRRIIANCNLKPKNLIGIPWRVAFALQADGWILRSDIIWHKKNPMPESVKDRPTKAHEYIFLLSKQPRYYYDNEAVREAHTKSWDETNNNRGNYSNGTTGYDIKTGIRESRSFKGLTQQITGRNRRTVWTVSTSPFSGAHFAVFPPDLIRPCILAGCPTGGVVLDPFMGSGTVAQVAIETGRNWLGVELNPEYIELAKKRIYQTQPPLPIEAVL